MSNINADSLKFALGEKYDPNADYIVARHRDAPVMGSKGYKLVGEIKDATDNGTMLVFDRRKQTVTTEVWSE